ncbi:acyltransferase [Spirosoma flavum]|uniref:Acyltransferase n=1 Tax=Spirosoma flavum TaxID=2048557 RepID=A0ABW6AE76_9BACT
MSIVELINQNSRVKGWIHYLLIPRNKARPRHWVSWVVNPWVHKKGAGSHVCSSARMDILPFRKFELGQMSTVEDYCVINNGVGDVIIGEYSRIGIGSVIIGPVTIGNQVLIAQHVVISGLNHGYQAIDLPIGLQPVTALPILIDDECWIGANAVITAGVQIGKHAVVAAGSIVTKDVPAYSVVAGNPAKVIKYYDQACQSWIKAGSS